MFNIRKISCLAFAAIFILSFAGCKNNIRKEDLSSSEVSATSQMPEYSVSQAENGQEIVVDKDGKPVENAKINEDGAIEIIDKETGKPVKTIPKAEVKKYEEIVSDKKTSSGLSPSDSSKNDNSAATDNSKTDSGSRKDNPTSSSKPAVSTPSATTDTGNKGSDTTTPSKPPQPTTSTPSEKPNTTDTSVMSQAELNSVAEYFFQLVNQERAKVGAQPLTRKDELDGAAKTRVAETFTVLGHTRPDGRDFSSILTDIKYGTPREDIWSSDGINWNKTIVYDYGVSGENLAHIGNTDKQECKNLAERFFTNLKNSSGHYRNMTDSDFGCTGIAVLEKFENNMHIYNIIQIFTTK